MTDRLKLITLACLTLAFIGCGGQEVPDDPNPDDNDVNVHTPIVNDSANNPDLPMALEEGVLSQSILTCSKEGEDIVYIAKTYEIKQPCSHPKAGGKTCSCEVFSSHSKFSNQNEVFLFATGDGKDWCQETLNELMNNPIVNLPLRGNQTKNVSSAHDASWTCTLS